VIELHRAIPLCTAYNTAYRAWHVCCLRCWATARKHVPINVRTRFHAHAPPHLTTLHLRFIYVKASLLHWCGTRLLALDELHFSQRLGGHLDQPPLGFSITGSLGQTPFTTHAVLEYQTSLPASFQHPHLPSLHTAAPQRSLLCHLRHASCLTTPAPGLRADLLHATTPPAQSSDTAARLLFPPTARTRAVLPLPTWLHRTAGYSGTKHVLRYYLTYHTTYALPVYHGYHHHLFCQRHAPRAATTGTAARSYTRLPLSRTYTSLCTSPLRTALPARAQQRISHLCTSCSRIPLLRIRYLFARARCVLFGINAEQHAGHAPIALLCIIARTV